MCGRAAQSVRSVLEASTLLGSTSKAALTETEQNVASASSSSATKSPYHENVQNMSPGYTFYVFHKQEDSSAAAVVATPMVWGLVTRPGTMNEPIPPGPSKHFANLMFNARSEEASTKVTFGKLIRNQKSCIISLDGFYEWKSEGAGNYNKRKQPYFVHMANRKPLLVAGLYTSVSVGGPQQQEEESTAILTTFTIFTTQASTQLSWLHTRMPLVLTNTSDALEWIHKPSPELLKILSTKASNSGTASTGHSNPKNEGEITRKTTPTPLSIKREEQDLYQLAWHPVTQKMNSSSYKGYDCMNPIPLCAVPSIKSFFTSKEPSSLKDSQSLVGEKHEDVSIPPNDNTTMGIFSSHEELKRKRKSLMEQEVKDEMTVTKLCMKEMHDIQSSDLPSPLNSESNSRREKKVTIKKRAKPMKSNANHKAIQSFFVSKTKPF